MPRRQGGSLSGFSPLSTPNAPTDLSVSTSIGSASVSFTAPTDTGDAAVTSYIVTAIDESTGASTGATGSASPITISPGGGTFKIRAQAVNGFGPGRLTEFSTGNAILSGLQLYAFGENSGVSSGQLGDGTVIPRSSPVQIGALTNWLQASAGGYHSAAVKTDNTLWSWGDNSAGQLGDNSVTDQLSPVQIGALTNWAQVSAGRKFTAAIKTGGTLWAWGYGYRGQLGNGSTADRSSPVQVGALTNWAQVSAGKGSTTAAVKTDGTLWCWGQNNNGQVGDGTITQRNSPVQIGALTNWAQVSMGSAHAAAIKTDGTLWCWGGGASGRLGQNDGISRSSPVQVGVLTDWYQVSAGAGATFSIKNNGTLWAFGGNNDGQLGDQTTENKSSPVQIGSLTNWSYVFAFDHSSALKTDGTLWTWGENADGQLGHNNTIARSSPTQVGALTDWFQVAAGRRHTLALLGVV